MRKKYSWEDEAADDELDEEDPIIGDEWKIGIERSDPDSEDKPCRE